MKAEGGGRRAEEEVASGQWPVASRSAINDQRSTINNFPPSALRPPPSALLSALRPPLSILLLGDTSRTEFREAPTCLARWGVVHGFAEVAAAAAALVEGEVVPDVIVVAQAFPGQVSHQAVDHLRRLAPVARVVGLMGSWCEGEMRTGWPWPGAVRTYWHQWAARCNRELRRLASGECCSWTLPPTATEEDRLLADMAEHGPRRHGLARISHHTGKLADGVPLLACPAVPSVIGCPALLDKPAVAHCGEKCGLVVIRTRSHEMALWLSAACRSRGFATVWQRTATTACVEGAMAAIFDGADLSEDQSSDLGRLATTLHPAPVVVLLAFPRVEDYRRALSAGAAAVVSKPLAVDDLFWELERGERGERREERGE